MNRRYVQTETRNTYNPKHISPLAVELRSRCVVLLVDALPVLHVMGREPVDQLLVTARAHHLDLLPRPRVHRDRSHETEDQRGVDHVSHAITACGIASDRSNGMTTNVEKTVLNFIYNFIRKKTHWVPKGSTFSSL